MTFQRKVEIELIKLVACNYNNAAISKLAASILEICGVEPNAHFVSQGDTAEKLQRHARIVDAFKDATVRARGSYVVISGCGLELCLNINAWGAITGFLDDTSGG